MAAATLSLLLSLISFSQQAPVSSVNIVELNEDGEALINVDRVGDDGDSELSLSFLTKYGYLPKAEEGKSFLMTDESVRRAIKVNTVF